MSLTSLEVQINKLIEEINNSPSITGNELLKTKLALQLNKVSISLKLTNNLMKLYDKADEIDENLLSINIKDLSTREVLVLNSVITKKIDNSYNRINAILNTIKVSEIEAALLMINNLNKNETNNLPITEKSKVLSMEMLRKLTEQGYANKEGSLVDAFKDSADITSKLDSVGEEEFIDLPRSSTMKDVTPLVRSELNQIEDEDDRFLDDDFLDP